MPLLLHNLLQAHNNEMKEPTWTDHTTDFPMLYKCLIPIWHTIQAKCFSSVKHLTQTQGWRTLPPLLESWNITVVSSPLASTSMDPYCLVFFPSNSTPFSLNSVISLSFLFLDTWVLRFQSQGPLLAPRTLICFTPLFLPPQFLAWQQ